MAFNVGAIKASTKVDTKKWDTGLSSMVKSTVALGTAVSALAAGALTKAAKTSNEWLKSLGNVTTVTDASTVSNQKMATSLLNLDPALGQTKELTDAMYQSFSAGATDMDDALNITTESAKFATAAMTETSTAVDVLTTVTNAYGKENVSVNEASDVLFKTIEKGKTTGDELSSVIGRSIPLFASMNIPVEQLGSGIAAMTAQGNSAAEATTQLNAMINAFIKPSGEMSKALEEQGYESGSALLETEGLTGALDFLQESTGGSKEALAAMLPSMEAVRGAMALSGEGGDKYAETLVEMESAAGATDEAFNKQEKTYATLQSALNKIEIVVGNVANYFATDLAEGATTAATAMLSFVMSSSMAETVGDIVGGAAAAFSLLVDFAKPLAEEIGPGLSSVLETVGTTINDLTGDTGGAATAMSGLAYASEVGALGFKVLISMVNGAITTFGSLVTAIEATGSTVSSFFSFIKGDATWEDVKSNASSAADSFKDFGGDVADSFVNTYDILTDGLDDFDDAVADRALNMESNMKTSFTGTKDHVTTNWQEMITGQKAALDEMTSAFDDANTEIEDGSDESTDKQKSNIDALKEAYLKMFDATGTTASDVFSTIMQASSELTSGLSSIVSMTASNATDEAELEYQKREEALEKSLAAGAITEDEYDEQLEIAEEEKLEKQNEANEKAFDSNKSLKKANIIISAAQSVASWWATAGTLGPIAGPIFATAMTAATAVMAAKQIALVDEQQFVPEKAEGGMASGTTLINEVGGEIVSLPDGSQVIPNDISQQIAASSGSQSVSNSVTFTGNMTVRSDSDITAIANKVSQTLGKKLRG